MRIFKAVFLIVFVLVALGYTLPALWPLVENTLSQISGMSGGQSTSIIQAMWPILLIAVAIIVGIGLIFWALKQIGLFGGNKHD